ncbi:bifunctional lysylphosphatidylglycerol flippase/synthetase MprF [Okibacterium endophyticum]
MSIALAAVFVVCAVLAGSALAPIGDESSLWWGAGVSSTVGAVHWWTPVTALLIAGDPLQLVLSVLAALAVFGAAERLMGPMRAAFAFLATGVVGVTIGVLLQTLGQSIGEWWSTATADDLSTDPFVGIAGAIMTASAFASVLWRRRIRVVTLAFILIFVLYAGDPVNMYRLLAALAGLLLGAILARDRSTLRLTHSSHMERRELIATVVAVSAVGPLVALTNPTSFTPLALVSSLFGDTFPDRAETLARCADDATAACEHDLALVSAAGVGPVLLSLMPLLLLIVAAIGLRKGRRAALWLAIGVNAAFVVISFAGLDVATDIQQALADSGTAVDVVEWVVWVGSAVLVPVAIAALLLINRGEFALVAPREALIGFGSVTALVFVVLAVVYFVVGFFTLGSYVPATTPPELALDTLMRFVPSSLASGLDTVIVPTDPIAIVVYRWAGVVFWVAVIVGLLRLFRATDSRARLTDHHRVQQLLRREGGGTLGYMATWPGNVYWFSDDGDAAVTYRVTGGIALTLSDPICPTGREEQTIREFAAFCDTHNWTPAFYSVHEEHVPVFDRLGWQCLSVGEETLMHPQQFDLVGKPWQKVRQALNKGIKAGITTEWTTYRELSVVRTTQLKVISEQWVSEKALPEMGFTLGGMDELKDPEVKLMLAIGPDDRVQAITSWLPMYRDGRVVGWTIDFMRRADDSMPGIMEFLIASAALHMKETGIEVLSLSGAPLAKKPGDVRQEPTAMDRLLTFLADTLEPAYGFSSLFRFKAKFNPTYSTIYLAYPDPLALPAIGTAISRAYLPDVSPKQAAELVRTLVAR